MYKCNNLNHKGLEEYPLKGVILGNTVVVIWLVLGSISAHYIHPLLGIVYLISSFGMVYFLLRKVVCTSCYYYGKRCALGWGLISAMFFPREKAEDFGKGLSLKLPMITYGSLTLIPLVLFIVGLITDFSYFNLILVIIFFLVSFYSAFGSRHQACSRCKMRKTCPGSVVK